MPRLRLGEKEVEYKVIVKPVKYVTIRILEDGTLLVVSPSEEIVEYVLRKKSRWILSKLRLVEDAIRFSNSGFPLFGEFLSVENAPSREEIKRMLRKEVLNIAGEVGRALKVRPKRVYIKVMKRKWGSTTWRGSITIDLSAAALPRDLLHYLVTHEMCHLIEMNHGKKFWSLVSRFHPDYKEKRRELKRWWFIVRNNEVWKAILRLSEG
ncbi:M48 family metallopeptidase [Pyrococcus abyssi]|uniref:Zinc metallopeptidase, putative n=1 Tax=Pyrococcus abyssi (strain GE5 / Orsay) TaxID=272844 RepID=Q9UZ23_PYRAB|nr:M48 family metallopeptidase [Pyrococcus abyssi]CAB50239.1 Zinc metallopeptidase, putative [Pyrococcus abyssi GE5]CCE70776.1 TPA: hypothetical protein PAB1496 [Pyrococcus abyssi GE5]